MFKRRSRLSRRFIDWFGRPLLASDPFGPSIMAGIAGSALTDWAGITKVGFVCCAISMAGRVAVDCKRPALRQTGVVLPWRSSVEWSCSKAYGKPRRTIPAHKPASRKWTWKLKISRSPWLRRRDSEATARVVGGRWQSARWRSSEDYVVRGGRGDPRGRKSGGGSGVDNPTWPTRAEGEKRFRSLIRNP